MAEDTANSLITEEVKRLVGTEVGPLIYEIEKGAIKKVAKAIEDDNPLWQDEEYAARTKYGSIIAPPTFIALLRIRDQLIVRFRDVECPLPKSVVDGGIEIEYFRPIKPGDVIAVTAKIVDAQEHKGKPILFGFLETTYTNQQGEVVTKTRQTIIRM